MRRPRLLTELSLCALVLFGCAKAKPAEEAVEKAASVVPVPGTDRVRVRLTPEAVKRLDLRTDTIKEAAVPPRVTPGAAPPAAAAPVPPEADAAAAKPKKGAPAPPAPPPPPPVTAPAAVLRRVIPFTAVLYAPSGDAFTYVNVEPELYERTPIKVDYISGAVAVLADGPLPGTAVVTVGGPELSGAEFGVGE